MSKSVNLVVLLGNVGKDPEIRTTGGGTIVANFTLATTDRTKDGQGNWQDRTEWHNLVAFTRTAEIVRDYVKKGSKIHIMGRIQTRSWDDKESNQKRYKTEVVINDLSLLSSPDGAGRDGAASGNGNGARNSYANSNGAKNQGNSASGPADEYAGAEISDEDIPF